MHKLFYHPSLDAPIKDNESCLQRRTRKRMNLLLSYRTCHAVLVGLRNKILVTIRLDSEARIQLERLERRAHGTMGSASFSDSWPNTLPNTRVTKSWSASSAWLIGSLRCDCNGLLGADAIKAECTGALRSLSCIRLALLRSMARDIATDQQYRTILTVLLVGATVYF